MPFISFSCLSALPRVPVACWIEVVKIGLLTLFLSLEEKLSRLSQLSIIFAMGFSKWLLLCEGSFLLFLFCWVFLITKGCWILSNAFYVSIEVIMCFFFLHFLALCIMLINFRVLNHPYFPAINPTWSWYIILLIFCWILFASILLRIFFQLGYFLKFWWDITQSMLFKAF